MSRIEKIAALAGMAWLVLGLGIANRLARDEGSGIERFWCGTENSPNGWCWDRPVSMNPVLWFAVYVGGVLLIAAAGELTAALVHRQRR